MRIFLRILAVIVGLISAMLAIGSCLVFVGAILACFQNYALVPKPSPQWMLVFLMAFSAGIAFLGFLMVVQVVRFLRMPNVKLAKDVLGIAFFLFVVEFIGLSRDWLRNGPGGGQFAGWWELSGNLLAGAVLFLAYQFLVKRLNAGTFSSPAPDSHA